MNWKNIFRSGEVVTASDRAELEQLETSTAKLRSLASKIDVEWPDSSSRIDRLRDLAGQLAENPDDPGLLRRLELVACMPSHPQTGYQHRDAVLGRLNEKIEQLMEPAVEIVRRCLRRALEQAEAELKRTEGKERKLADEEGYNYSPSGRVLALQQRVLELRNAVAVQYKHEGAIQNPGPWRDRLREWL